MKRISCTFYRPQQVNTREYANINANMESDLNTLCTEAVMAEDVYQYVCRLVEQATPLKRRPEMFFLGLDEPEKMPGDARVEFFYKPTYIGAAIIIRSILLHPELLDTSLSFDWRDASRCREAIKSVLPGLLLGCTGRGFSGHGYDGLQGLIETLTIFTKAGTAEFIDRYPEICDTFSSLYVSSIRSVEEMVQNGKAQNEWGDDYTEEAERLLKLYRGEESNSDKDEQEQRGKTIHDKDAAPAKGPEKKATAFENSPFIWYACYGSNLSSTRFQRYLDGCGGNVSETESRSFTADGTLYFAADSGTWGRGKGVAFFDESASGTVMMRIYKLSRSQFLSVKAQEGSKYSRELALGTIDNVPVFTLTAPEKQKDLHVPSTDYVNTILKGLKETYPNVSETVLLSYVFKHIAISDDARKVLAFIRSAPHAVTNREILESSVCGGTRRVKDAVLLLLDLGLIKQDSRSRRAGHQPGAPEAMYFTVPENRNITDMLVFGII